MKKGIIFDMDGTLWDSSTEVAFSWSKAVASSGITEKSFQKEDIMRVMGKPMDELAALLFPELGKREQEQLLASCCEVENAYLREHGAILYENVEEVLRALSKEYFLAIVSNCQCGYIEAFLEYYGLEEYISDLQCFGMNGLPKGENIRLVVERNALDEAIYIGDIQGDYEASQAAGVGFIHASYGFGTIADPVPYVESFSEIPKAVEAYMEGKAAAQPLWWQENKKEKNDDTL